MSRYVFGVSPTANSTIDLRQKSALERAGWPARPADLAGLSQVGFTAPAHINRLVFKDVGEVTLPTSVQAENGEAVRALVLGGMGGGAV